MVSHRAILNVRRYTAVTACCGSGVKKTLRSPCLTPGGHGSTKQLNILLRRMLFRAGRQSVLSIGLGISGRRNSGSHDSVRGRHPHKWC